VFLVGLVVIESILEWTRVLSGRKQAAVREAPFVRSDFAEEQA
jgi:hypothetical protein